MKQPKIGVGVFLTKLNINGDVFILVGKRKSPHGENKWELPGGALEYEETIINCGLRELKEETGITDVEVHCAREFTEDIFEDSHWVSFFVHATCKWNTEASLMESNKCEEWRWVTLDDLKQNYDLFLPLKNFLCN